MIKIHLTPRNIFLFQEIILLLPICHVHVGLHVLHVHVHRLFIDFLITKNNFKNDFY